MRKYQKNYLNRRSRERKQKQTGQFFRNLSQTGNLEPWRFFQFFVNFFFFLKRWRQNYLVLTLAARCRDYRLARNAAGTSAFSCGEYSRGRPMLCREWWLSHRLTFRHWNCVCNTRASVHCHSLARRHHRRITFVIDVMILSSTPTYFHCVSKVSRDWR